MFAAAKKPGHKGKSEQERDDKEQADRATAKAAAAGAKTAKLLEKVKKMDKSGGASSSSATGSSKKKSKAVAFASNQGVRVDGARNAVHEESEEEEELEEEIVDTRLYCVCKQMYDDDRLMIACDKYVKPIAKFVRPLT